MRLERAWITDCMQCGGQRVDLAYVSDLGARASVCLRYCGCPIEYLYGPALPPKVDPEPPEDGTV